MAELRPIRAIAPRPTRRILHRPDKGLRVLYAVDQRAHNAFSAGIERPANQARIVIGDPHEGGQTGSLGRRQTGDKRLVVSKSMLLVDSEGVPTLCVALTAQDLRAHWEIARDQDAPAELLAALEGHAKVPFFWQGEGFYGPECTDWRAALHPAEVLEGAETYYYALIASPPNVDAERIYAYDRYLEVLDAAREG